MAFKWIVRFTFLISFLPIFESAPVYMFASFQELLIDSNCTVPKSIRIPENISINETLLNVTSSACSNITNSTNDRKLAVYELCRQVFKNFASLLLCDSDEEESKTVSDYVMIPYPDNDVCDGFAGGRNSQIECLTANFNSTSVCESLCDNNMELCKFLLWTCQAKSFLDEDGDRDDKVTSSEISSSHDLKISPVNNKTKNEVNLNGHLNQPDSSREDNPLDDGKTNHQSPATTQVKKEETINHILRINKTTSNVVTLQSVQAMTIVNDSSKATVHKNSKGTLTTVSPTLNSSVAQMSGNDSVESFLKNKVDALDNKDVEPSIEDEIHDYNAVATSKVTAESNSYEKSGAIYEDVSLIGTSNRNSMSSQSVYDNSVSRFDKGIPGEFMEPGDSHFFLFFLCVVGILIGCYVLFHNKQKIIALIIEGRHERRRRPNGVSYKKLETKQ